MRSGKVHRPTPSFVAVAHANALRMERLIDDLLELSRAETGAVSLEREEVPMQSFLSRVAEFHRLPAQRAGKTLEVVASEGTLHADVRKLTLAVSNLVDNAIKYGKEGGRITVSGKIEPSGCTLEVMDDGPGIPPEDLPRIFERFYRVDKGRSTGTGRHRAGSFHRETYRRVARGDPPGGEPPRDRHAVRRPHPGAPRVPPRDFVTPFLGGSHEPAL